MAKNLESLYPDHVVISAPEGAVHISGGADLIVLKSKHKPITVVYNSLFSVEDSSDIIAGFDPTKDKIDIRGVLKDLGSEIGIQNLRFYSKDGNMTLKINDDKYGFGENEYTICTFHDFPLGIKEARKADFIIA